MNPNLDSLQKEIQDALHARGFAVFHGYARLPEEDLPEIQWDTRRYPDYHAFLDVAGHLGAKVVIFHHRDLTAALIDDALAQIEESTADYDIRRQMSERVRSMRIYEGFTSVIQLSFDQNQIVYIYELRTEWFDELHTILDELDLADEDGGYEDDDNPLGGYYSKN